MVIEVTFEDLTHEEFDEIAEIVDPLISFRFWNPGAKCGIIRMREGVPMPTILAKYALNLQTIDERLASLPFFKRQLKEE
jgi:hypothetical protein